MEKTLSERKKRVREDERFLRRREWADRRKHVRCWWTFPLGHAYENGQCVGCGRWFPLNL